MSDSVPSRPRLNRVVVKLSGEGFSGPKGSIDPDIASGIVDDLVAVANTKIELAIVVGGGNFVRGASMSGMNRAVADQMGMLATAMNGLALQDMLEARNVETRVMSAVPMASFSESFIRRRCIRHLEKKRVVILVAGTGNPFFTTDSAAALRASEVGADALLKATQVDGVFSADPKLDPQATRYDSLGYRDVIRQGLRVMDTSAVVLCDENQIPIVVFDLHRSGNLGRVCAGEPVGTLIGSFPEH